MSRFTSNGTNQSLGQRLDHMYHPGHPSKNMNDSQEANPSSTQETCTKNGPKLPIIIFSVFIGAAIIIGGILALCYTDLSTPVDSSEKTHQTLPLSSQKTDDKLWTGLMVSSKSLVLSNLRWVAAIVFCLFVVSAVIATVVLLNISAESKLDPEAPTADLQIQGNSTTTPPTQDNPAATSPTQEHPTVVNPKGKTSSVRLLIVICLSAFGVTIAIFYMASQFVGKSKTKNYEKEGDSPFLKPNTPAIQKKATLQHDIQGAVNLPVADPPRTMRLNSESTRTYPLNGSNQDTLDANSRMNDIEKTLEDIARLAAENENIGMATINALGQQKENLEECGKQLQGIDGNMDVARRTLGNMEKRYRFFLFYLY